MTERMPFKRQDSISGLELTSVERSPSYPDDTKDAFDTKDNFATEKNEGHKTHLNPADEDVSELDAKNRLANGKERPIETAEDIATRSVKFPSPVLKLERLLIPLTSSLRSLRLAFSV